MSLFRYPLAGFVAGFVLMTPVSLMTYNNRTLRLLDQQQARDKVAYKLPDDYPFHLFPGERACLDRGGSFETCCEPYK